MKFEPTLSPRTSIIKRLDWVDSLRGIAVLAVVLFHSQGMVQDNSGDYPRWLEWINDALRPIRMPLLMFLSGLLLPKSLMKPARTYVVGKLARIGWPYLIWSFVLLGLLTIVSPITGNVVDPSRYARVFYDPPTYHWYLAYLLLFYLVTLLLPGRVRPYLIIVALASAGFITDGNWQQMVYLFAFFLIGELFARHSVRVMTWVNSAPGTVACLALTAAMIGISIAGVDMRYSSVWAPLVAGAIGVAIRGAGLLSHTRMGLFFAGAGRQSIVFYVTHWPILLVVFHLLYRAGVGNPLVLAIIVPGLAIASGFAILWAATRWPALYVAFALPTRRMRVGKALDA